MLVHEFTISSVFAQGFGVCHTDIIWSTNLENFLGKNVTIGIYEVHVASDETRFQTHFTYLLISRNMDAEFYSPSICHAAISTFIDVTFILLFCGKCPRRRFLKLLNS